MLHRDLPKPWPRLIPDYTCSASVPPPPPEPNELRFSDAVIYTCPNIADELVLSKPGTDGVMVEVSLCAQHRDEKDAAGEIIRNPRLARSRRVLSVEYNHPGGER